MEFLKFLSASEIVAQIVNFLLLLFLLRLFFWKRILKLLDERKARITSEFKNIEEAKKGMEGLKAEYETKLNSIEAITKVKIQEAVDEGKIKAVEIIKKANLEAQKNIDSARADIKYEINKAKEQLKEEIIDLTIGAVEGVIKDKLTEADDKKIVEEFLKNIDK
ncbi:MAG: F0F1 ATP synthase subunit B, partial [Candidatus Omnitrophica bacterium]|nr:F0F1 ATP synthase subunit B [Candidatus Omnitrophota bacterium]